MKLVNAIHPGRVRSTSDGQEHYVGYIELINLHGLNPAECFLWRDDVGRRYVDYEHYYPRMDGRYGGNNA